MLEGAPPDLDDPNLLPPTQPDRLERITALLRRVRDLRLDAEDWEARRKVANAEINDLTFRQLPELFQQAATTNVGLAPEGNLPGFQATLKPYHKANISAEWPLEKRIDGFNHLRDMGGADLVRNTIIVEFGRGEDEMALRLADWLIANGMSYTRSMTVPWASLTAWLREQCLKFRRDFTRDQLEAIGATVGHVVEVKQVKS